MEQPTNNEKAKKVKESKEALEKTTKAKSDNEEEEPEEPNEEEPEAPTTEVEQERIQQEVKQEVKEESLAAEDPPVDTLVDPATPEPSGRGSSLLTFLQGKEQMFVQTVKAALLPSAGESHTESQLLATTLDSATEKFSFSWMVYFCDFILFNQLATVFEAGR